MVKLVLVLQQDVYCGLFLHLLYESVGREKLAGYTLCSSQLLQRHWAGWILQECVFKDAFSRDATVLVLVKHSF